MDIQTYSEKKILRVLVPRGDDAPYAVDENKIYVRSEAETGLAVRDEIVELVMRQIRPNFEETKVEIPSAMPVEAPSPTPGEGSVSEPRTGVEVVNVEDRNGTKYFTLRDMRNGSMVKNVTTKSARRLWHYAITAHLRLPEDITRSDIQWQGQIGLIRHQKQGRIDRYDLVHLQQDGSYRVFYGVTEDGIHDQWKNLIDDNESEE